MTDDVRIDQYLAAATDGLAGDPELQREVQAELRSHLEARLAEPGEAGADPVAAALAALGPAVDAGEALVAANRHRVRRRTLLRRAVQWGLAPAAVAAALLAADRSVLSMVRVVAGQFDDASAQFTPHSRRLSDEDRLVLWGDPSRESAADGQKAIWERWPTNLIYAHNYVTRLSSQYAQMGETPGARYDALVTALEPIRSMDPDNARFEYLLAAKGFDAAAEITDSRTNGPDGQKVGRLNLVIHDRARLDEAMACLRRALAEPSFCRYSQAMLAERLARLGPPRTLAQQIASVGVAAGALLPDLADARKLARAGVLYGELLIAEGRAEEAGPFLDAWRGLTFHLNSDAFTLIDVLVVGAIADLPLSTEPKVPALYEQMGRPDLARKTEGDSARLSAPVKEWKARRKKAEDEVDSTLKSSAGIMAGLLLPALGEPVSTEDLKPSRMVEYAVVDGVVLSLVTLVLLAALAVCVAASVYLWLRRSAPLLLLPSPAELARLVVWGVLVPLAVFYAVTRWTPLGGREGGLRANLPRAVVLDVAVLVVLMLVPSWLGLRMVRARCRRLLVPVPEPGRRAGLEPERGRFRLYRGALARSLIPVYAIALLLVTLMSRPVLQCEQAVWLSRDRVMGVDPAGGFTMLESRLTQRLKAETAQAVAALRAADGR